MSTPVDVCVERSVTKSQRNPFFRTFAVVICVSDGLGQQLPHGLIFRECLCLLRVLVLNLPYIEPAKRLREDFVQSAVVEFVH